MAQDVVKTALRVPVDLHKRIHTEAKKSGRTFNAEVVHGMAERYGVSLVAPKENGLSIINGDSDIHWTSFCEETRLMEPDAPPPLEVDRVAEGAPAPVPGAIARIGGTLLCQTAAQWLSGHEEPEGQAGQADAAQVPGIDPAVRAQPGQSAGRYVTIVAGAHCSNVALYQV
jgi:hypothetical protein